MIPEVQEEIKPEKKKPWLWISLGMILLILSTCIYLYFAIWGDGSEKKEGIEGLKKISLSSFTVNLADSHSKRYLRTKITLEFYSKEVEKELEFSQHRVKDVVLEVLRSKKVSDVDTPEETELLRKELLKAVNSRLTKGKITGLYFEEFIIQ